MGGLEGASCFGGSTGGPQAVNRRMKLVTTAMRRAIQSAVGPIRSS